MSEKLKNFSCRIFFIYKKFFFIFVINFSELWFFFFKYFQIVSFYISSKSSDKKIYRRDIQSRSIQGKMCKKFILYTFFKRNVFFFFFLTIINFHPIDFCQFYIYNSKIPLMYLVHRMRNCIISFVLSFCFSSFILYISL